MTIVFDVEELYLLKQAYPSWVLLLDDKTKNPSRLVGIKKGLC